MTTYNVAYPPLAVPQIITYSGVTGGVYSRIDATGEQYAVVFMAHRTCNLRYITYKITTGSSNAAVDLKVSVQGQAATGFPDGTIKNSSNAYVTHNAPSAGIYRKQFGADAGVTLGEPFAVVFEQTGTIATLILGQTAMSGYNQGLGFPYTCLKAGAGPTWALNVGYTANFVLECDDGSYFECGVGHSYSTGLAQASIDSIISSGVNQAGNRIKIPYNAKAVGLRILQSPNTASNYYAVLQDDSGSQLAISNLIDGDHQANGQYPGYSDIYFTTPYEIAANTWYRALLKADNASARTMWLCAQFGSSDAAQMAMLELGTNCYATHRTGTGSFTNTAYERYCVSLLLWPEVAGAAAASGGSYGY